MFLTVVGVRCGKPPDGTNTVAVPVNQDGQFGDTYTYVCLCSYSSSHSMVVSCQANGAWTSPPVCTGQLNLCLGLL